MNIYGTTVRPRWWSLLNWLRGYKFGPVQRFRATTPRRSTTPSASTEGDQMDQAERDVRQVAPPVTSYHPKEFGATTEQPKVVIRSGLLGVLFMFSIVFAAVGVFILASPFLLLGLAEVVVDSPARWRIRWVRRAAMSTDGDGRSASREDTP